MKVPYDETYVGWCRMLNDIAETALAVGLLPPALAHDPDTLHALVQLINSAFVITRAQLWEPGADRIASDELASMISGGQILAASSGSEFVGCVRVHALGGGIAELGLLATDTSCHRRGLGRRLLAAAEAQARAAGMDAIELTVLRPRFVEESYSSFLTGWYERHGYTYLEAVAFEVVHPEASKRLLMPCDLRRYADEVSPLSKR